MLTLMMDTRERPEATKLILAEFERQGVKVIRSKMWVGDYQRLENPMLVVDRKRLPELCNNVVQDHRRFTAELQRAKDAGIHIVILVEHSRNVKKLDDVRHWVNPRLKVSPMAVSGERLYKILYTIEKHYGCEIQFCEKKDTGKRIIEILGKANEFTIRCKAIQASHEDLRCMASRSVDRSDAGGQRRASGQ